MSTDDRTILTTCQIHGAKGFCNLRVSKIIDEIVRLCLESRLILSRFV
jgi:hypothetical protein